MPLGVEALIENQPQIVALTKVIANPGVDKEFIGDAVVLQKGRGREMGVKCSLNTNLAQVRVELLVSIRETNEVEFVGAAQFQMTR